MTKTLTDTTRGGLEAKIAKFEARAKRERVAGTGELPKKSKWQPSNNREAYRRDGQPSGNEQFPVEKGGHRYIH
jgi:hypothetical protein